MQTEFSSWIEDYVAFGLALADRVLGIDRLVSHFQIEHLTVVAKASSAKTAVLLLSPRKNHFRKWKMEQCHCRRK